MAGIIGIKVANGDFYPIVGENSTVKKRLVLTTVHDNQDSVQIDLFRSISRSMLDAQYIGSLVVEDIRSCLKGEPSIEMLISANLDGNITAEAYDLDASPDSDHHILNVSLKTMDTFTKPEDFPDFEMENDEPQVAAGSYSQPRKKGERERKFPWGIMVAATLCVILGIAALWFFLLRDRDGRPIVEAVPGHTEQLAQPPAALEPPPQAPPPAVQPVQPPPPHPVETVAVPVSPEPPPPVVSPLVIQAPVAPPPGPAQEVQRQRPPAPVLSHRVPAVIPPNGVVYQIRWGDTLWDIAAAFYRNPLLYPRIARHNNIRDPNHILAGFNVRIPPLN